MVHLITRVGWVHEQCRAEALSVLGAICPGFVPQILLTRIVMPKRRRCAVCDDRPTERPCKPSEEWRQFKTLPVMR